MAGSSMAIGVSTGMAVAAAEEAERAEQEHRQACLAMLPTFSDKGSSLESKKAYAGCIETLYPDPVTPEQKHGMQICFFVLIAFTVAGSILAGRHADGFERFGCGLFGLCAGGAAIGMFFLIQFLFFT